MAYVVQYKGRVQWREPVQETKPQICQFTQNIKGKLEHWAKNNSAIYKLHTHTPIEYRLYTHVDMNLITVFPYFSI